MIKTTLILFTVLLAQNSFSQTTATDFTANDCAGNSHTLFSELDAGKIIVVAFVMPCGGCIAPSQAAYNAVQSFASSHPGRVLFYLSDDNGTTACSSINSFATSNSMSLATRFSTTAFNQGQYGTPGMPKIVVLGGTDHAVVYNQNSGVTTNNVTAAINGLIAAGIEDVKESELFNMQIVPNPVVNDFKFNYTLDKTSAVKIEIFSLTGTLVYEKNEENQTQGAHSVAIADNENLKKGLYILKLTTDNRSESIQFTVAK